MCPVLYVFSMLSLGHTVMSDLVVTNLFMHSHSSMILLYLATPFLNQARAGRRPVSAWFLKIASVCELQYVCVCVRPEAINN